jgi:hypothetical protein
LHAAILTHEHPCNKATLRRQLNILQRKSPKRSLSAISIIWFLPDSIGLRRAL